MNVTKKPSSAGHKPGVAPGELAGGPSVALLAVMLFLAPAIGATTEELIQDTLKSIVVSGFSLLALVTFFWRIRAGAATLRWHGVLWLPVALCCYALGSMVWSHIYLGGAEAIRWFVFAVIVWLGLNTFTADRFKWLAYGIHTGAVVASLWTALQFWFDFKGFPQGPNPASTFVNRNFFAEFVVCTLPFSAWLLWKARGTAGMAVLAFSLGFNVVAMLMTGTRSALIASGVGLLISPLVVWCYLKHWRPVLGEGWSQAERWTATGVLLITVAVLGNIPTGNAAMQLDHQLGGVGETALQRSVFRSQSITQPKEYTEGSFSLRWVMWNATGRMIQARPWSGVGAGAWEVDIPLYQSAGSQLETDYYVHNEVLQLVAEYGLVGWLFLLTLLAYLAQAAWRTLTDCRTEAIAEALMRTSTLICLLLFLITSTAGFPWRMAATGALFAICLGILAASDVRLGYVSAWGRLGLGASTVRWGIQRSALMLGVSSVALALCLYISQLAVTAESKIVSAVKIALTITASGKPNDPQWNGYKNEMYSLLREGIAINRHYRKITPMVADEAAKWGDWKNAVWIWESVADSRPYVVAVMTNVARGYSILNQYDKAFVYLARCQKLQPFAPVVRSLEVILKARTGQIDESMNLIRVAMAGGMADLDTVTAAYVLGMERKDYDMALQGLALKAKSWPDAAADSWLKTAHLYADPSTPKFDAAKALQTYQLAVDFSKPEQRDAMRQEIPADYRGRLR